MGSFTKSGNIKKSKLKGFQFTPFKWVNDTLLFGYFFPYMRLAVKQDLTLSKLPQLQVSDDIEPLANLFLNKIDKEWEKKKGPSRFATIRILLSLFWSRYIILFLFRAFYIIFRIASSFFFKRILQWQENIALNSVDNNWKTGFYCAWGIVILEMSAIVIDSQRMFWCRRLQYRIEKVLTSCIFQRLLISPSNSTAVETMLGKENIHKKPVFEIKDLESSVYNLLIVDVKQIALGLSHIVDFVILPVNIMFAYKFVCRQTGNAAPISVGVLLAFSFFIIGLELISATMQKSYLKQRDIRLSRCHDIFTEARALKIVGWKEIVFKEINIARENEMKILETRTYLTHIAAGLSRSLAAITCVSFFTVYILWSDAPLSLKASFFFPVQQAIQFCIRPLSQLGTLVQRIILGKTSSDRFDQHLLGGGPSCLSPFIQKTLLHDQCIEESEKDPLINTKATKIVLKSEELYTPIETTSIQCHHGIQVDNAIFTWDSLQQNPSMGNGLSYTPCKSLSQQMHHTLQVPHLRVRPGECVAIIGLPGSGKTSLLLGLLGEMRLIQGYSNMTSIETSIPSHSNLNPLYHTTRDQNRTIGYSSQTPWLPTGTVRSAILFGRPYDADTYRRVTVACELLPDFLNWGEEGDLRYLSENGGNLSGGQKTRIGVARALYNCCISKDTTSGIYLLDNPFVFADPKVGLNIFQNLFGKDGLLKNSSTIITIDITSLNFFINEIHSKNQTLGVTMYLQQIDNCLLSTQQLNLSLQKHWIPDMSSSMIRHLNTHKTDSTAVVYPLHDKKEHLLCQYKKHVFNEETCRIPLTETTIIQWLFKPFGKRLWFICFLLCILLRCFILSSDVWLGYWSREFSSLIKLTDQTDVSHDTKELFPHKKNSTAPVGFKHSYNNMTQQSFNTLDTLYTEQSSQFLKIYIGISMSIIFVSIILGYVQAKGLIQMARRIHQSLIQSILSAPLWFFDYVPIGIIMNRFGMDMLKLDQSISTKFWILIKMLFASIFAILIIIIVTPVLGCFLMGLLCFLLYWTTLYYVPANREIQRLQLIAYSPLCGLFNEVTYGAKIIRAMNREKNYTQLNTVLNASLLQTQYVSVGMDCWLFVRLKLFLLPFLTIIAFSPMILTSIPSHMRIYCQWISMSDIHRASSVLGLTITIAFSIPDILGFTLCSWGEYQSQMCSARRLLELRYLSHHMNEDLQHIIDKTTIPETTNGSIKHTGLELNDITVCYTKPCFKSLLSDRSHKHPTSILTTYCLEDYPPALINMTAKILPGEHIGIVGRTGSGKSTLLLSLLNQLQLTKGSIVLDDININQLSDKTISTIIGILPQFPFILKGWTIRLFLDPYNEFSSDQLNEAISIVGLTSIISYLPNLLNTILLTDPIYKNSCIQEGKKNTNDQYQTHSFCVLSDSQIRMLSIARLILHKERYRILLVDEPPADTISMTPLHDFNQTITFSKTVNDSSHTICISQLLRQLFPNTIVLIVAHHATSIRDCDKIWILSNGRLIAESQMASEHIEGGQDDLMQLIENAEMNYNKNSMV